MLYNIAVVALWGHGDESYWWIWLTLEDSVLLMFGAFKDFDWNEHLAAVSWFFIVYIWSSPNGQDESYAVTGFRLNRQQSEIMLLAFVIIVSFSGYFWIIIALWYQYSWMTLLKSLKYGRKCIGSIVIVIVINVCSLTVFGLLNITLLVLSLFYYIVVYPC